MKVTPSGRLVGGVAGSGVFVDIPGDWPNTAELRAGWAGTATAGGELVYYQGTDAQLHRCALDGSNDVGLGAFGIMITVASSTVWATYANGIGVTSWGETFPGWVPYAATEDGGILMCSYPNPSGGFVMRTAAGVVWELPDARPQIYNQYPQAFFLDLQRGIYWDTARVALVGVGIGVDIVPTIGQPFDPFLVDHSPLWVGYHTDKLVVHPATDASKGYIVATGYTAGTTATGDLVGWALNAGESLMNGLAIDWSQPMVPLVADPVVPPIPPIPPVPPDPPVPPVPPVPPIPPEVPMSDALLSSNRRFRLLMQNDGNLVIYKTDGSGPIWASGSVQPEPGPGPGPGPIPGPKPWETVTVDQLRNWSGRISTVLWNGPLGFRPGQPNNTMFTAQYDNPGFTADERVRQIAAFPSNETHWPLGPLVQRGYHGMYPDTNFVDNPSHVTTAMRELWEGGKYPVLFLLDDIGMFADGNGVNREAIERVLTPIYSAPAFQAMARIVVAAWEPPNWDADTWQWVVRWMARVFPNALRYIHFPTGKGAPGRHSDLESGHYENEAALWNEVIPFIHGFLQQETWVFGDEDGWIQDDRTAEMQFEYDLMDKIRRFVFGSGSRAAAEGPTEVQARWDEVRGSNGKRYGTFDGHYLTTCADPSRPLDVVCFEYASYYVGQPHQFGTPEAVMARREVYAAIARSVWKLAGIGD